jgi:hypothetical protein
MRAQNAHLDIEMAKQRPGPLARPAHSKLTEPEANGSISVELAREIFQQPARQASHHDLSPNWITTLTLSISTNFEIEANGVR